MNTSTKEVFENQIQDLLWAGTLQPTYGIIGCGGAGSNVLRWILKEGIKDVDTIAINCDEKNLSNVGANVKILLNEEGTEDDHGLANLAREVIRSTLNVDIAFLVGGLGGKTGTIVLPAVAEELKNLGSLVIAVVVLPFSIEMRRDRAKEALRELRRSTKAVVVIENDSLLKIGESLPFNEAMAIVHRMIRRVIECILERLSRTFLGTIDQEVEQIFQEVEIQVNADRSLPENDEIYPSIKATTETDSYLSNSKGLFERL